MELRCIDNSALRLLGWSWTELPFPGMLQSESSIEGIRPILLKPKSSHFSSPKIWTLFDT